MRGVATLSPICLHGFRFDRRCLRVLAAWRTCLPLGSVCLAGPAPKRRSLQPRSEIEARQEGEAAIVAEGGPRDAVAVEVDLGARPGHFVEQVHALDADLDLADCLFLAFSAAGISSS